MSKEKINICLVNTIYSLFLYFLINGYNEKDIFIFTFLMPKEISKNIKHIQLPTVFFVDGPKMAPTNSIKGIIENIMGYCRYFYGYLKLRIILFVKTFNKDVAVYGHAQTPFSYMFYENENSNIIEDGLMNYTYPIIETHKINPIFDKILHICGIYFLNASEAFGSHKNIKNVYLTKNNDHPLIKDKVRVIDINDLWNNLSNDQKTKILNVFNIDSQTFRFDDKIALLLTEPLSEDELISFDDEINLYKEVISKFNEYSIIIKPHPREKKDYKEIFKDYEVINKYFPIEIFNLLDIEPEVVCSIISTALLNFKNSKVYIYEGDLKNEKLKHSRDELLKLIKKDNIELISDI